MVAIQIEEEDSRTKPPKGCTFDFCCGWTLGAFSAICILGLIHLLVFFLRSPVFNDQSFEKDVVTVVLCLLAIIIYAGLWTTLEELVCKQRVRVKAASQRLKLSQTFTQKRNTYKKIVEEVNEELTDDLKIRYQVENPEELSIRLNPGNIYDCDDFNVGQCTKDFNHDTDYFHICRICKDCLGLRLPHPAINCELLKMLDQVQNPTKRRLLKINWRLCFTGLVVALMLIHQILVLSLKSPIFAPKGDCLKRFQLKQDPCFEMYMLTFEVLFLAIVGICGCLKIAMMAFQRLRILWQKRS